eukprot:1239938-Amphidinium_carterae.1
MHSTFVLSPLVSCWQFEQREREAPRKRVRENQCAKCSFELFHPPPAEVFGWLWTPLSWVGGIINRGAPVVAQQQPVQELRLHTDQVLAPTKNGGQGHPKNEFKLFSRTNKPWKRKTLEYTF